MALWAAAPPGCVWTAVCGYPVKAQTEAAEQAVKTPGDTAKVRAGAEKVSAEQKDVRKAMLQELKDKSIPTTAFQ